MPTTKLDTNHGRPDMRRADLRHPIESLERTGDRWSQWSSVPMIEMSALETYRFLRARIPPPPQRVLEVGCGNGYVTLELARDGYTVVGLDQSPDILAVAHHSREASADTPGFGTVDYVCADIRTWPIPEDRFDVVLLNRTLHHLYDFQPLLTKLHGLLVPDGLLICQEYAYDRLDKRTASWVYAMQRLLFLSGLSPDNPATTPDDISSLQAFQTAWFEKAEKRGHPPAPTRTRAGCAHLSERYGTASHRHRGHPGEWISLCRTCSELNESVFVRPLMLSIKREESLVKEDERLLSLSPIHLGPGGRERPTAKGTSQSGCVGLWLSARSKVNDPRSGHVKTPEPI